MKKIGVCGHFAFGKEFFDGQTVKTKILTTELEKKLGKNQVIKADTNGGIKKMPLILMRLFGLLFRCQNIVVLPAHNGIRVFMPLLRWGNVIFRRKLHYVVIGGWLPEFLQQNPYIIKCLKHFSGIYVETNSMKQKLEKLGLDHIFVLPNCKEVQILLSDELREKSEEPFRFCTFSRVMREKGIETAIDAVQKINQVNGRTVCTLDIYGQIDAEYQQAFSLLQQQFPDFVSYRGIVDFKDSTNVLKQYFCLLFPTYYSGEGFAGTLIDAFASGLPVIASDWRYNAEIIDRFETGVIYPDEKFGDLYEAMCWMIENHKCTAGMQKKCISKAKEYLPERVIEILINELK